MIKKKINKNEVFDALIKTSKYEISWPDEGLKNRLMDAFLKKSFVDEIKERRRSVGIPDEGFLSIDEFLEWSESLTKKKLQSIISSIRQFTKESARELNLNQIDAYHIESYLCFGSVFKESMVSPFTWYSAEDIMPGHCSLEFDPNRKFVNLKIYPGTSQNKIREYLKQHWKTIKLALSVADTVPSDRRFRLMKKRHQKVYDLYKDGCINKYGILKDCSKKIPKYVEVMNADNRRKIIYQQRKKRT